MIITDIVMAPKRSTARTSLHPVLGAFDIDVSMLVYIR
jgi:hypothetical protein